MHRITQPVDNIPEDADLPAVLHPLAAKWRRLYDQLETLYFDHQVLTGRTIPDAQRARQWALLAAAEAGTPMPADDGTVAGLEQDARDLEAQYGVVQSVLADTGRILRTELRNHRAALAATARTQVDAAVAAYQLAMHNAATRIDAAAAQLSEASYLPEFIRSLDTPGAIGGETLPIMPEQLLNALANVKRVTHAATILDAAAEPVRKAV